MSTPNTRRRFQFTLRTMFVVMTVGAPCAWLGWDVFEVWQRKQMIAWIESRGGEVLRFREAVQIAFEERAREEAFAAVTTTLSRPSGGSQQVTPDEKVDDASADDPFAPADDTANPKDAAVVSTRDDASAARPTDEPSSPKDASVDFNALIDQVMRTMPDPSSSAADDPSSQGTFKTNLVVEIHSGQEILHDPPKPAPQLGPFRKWLGDASIETIFPPNAVSSADMTRIESMFPEAEIVKHVSGCGMF